MLKSAQLNAQGSQVKGLSTDQVLKSAHVHKVLRFPGAEVVQVLTHRCTRCHSTARASPR